jgi:iron complex outermembrane receptor protein
LGTGIGLTSCDVCIEETTRMTFRPACACACLSLAVASLPETARAGGAAVSRPSDLTRLSLEELTHIRVVSASRRPESSLEAAAAVHVVTREDLEQSGALSLPDALRLAPGVQAAQIDGDEWALAIRGHSGRLSRSMLVLMDGRSVWTPLFAGVFWDAQDPFLPDVERIEVSRGPGGPVYGANALNGVINVTTRSAADTQGGLLRLIAGGAHQMAGLRWGGHRGDDVYYRAYSSYAVRDGTRALTADGYDDTWTMRQGGFRLDYGPGDRDAFTIHGDLYRGTSGQPFAIAQFTPPFYEVLTGDADFRGGNLTARWRRATSRGEVTAQVYYDRTSRREVYFDEDRDTGDVDLQQHFRWGRHDTVWGLNYRVSHGRFLGRPTLDVVPGDRTDDIAGIFANDELRLAGERLRLSYGAKLEWNDYSGWNLQPSARASWTSGRRTFWASATRAVRTSSRLERDLALYASLSPTEPLFARTMGSADFHPESVRALEAGYKTWALSRLIVSASAFYNRYHGLVSLESGAPLLEGGEGSDPPRTVIPVWAANGHDGTASGAEVSALYSPAGGWRVQAAYSLLKVNEHPQPASSDRDETVEGNSPRHQLWVASFLHPRDRLDLGLVVRAVSGLPSQSVAAFADFDARVAYRPRPRLELALIGKNLGHAHHVEFGGGFAVERSVAGQAVFGF